MIRSPANFDPSVPFFQHTSGMRSDILLLAQFHSNVRYTDVVLESTLELQWLNEVLPKRRAIRGDCKLRNA